MSGKWDALDMRVTLTVDSDAPEIVEQGVWFGLEFVDLLGQETVAEARKLVAPGSGPGPHPHRTEHEDSGALRDAVFYDTLLRDGGQSAIAVISIDPEAPARQGGTPPYQYGVFLEMGWTAASGNHFRYPWLYPAAMIAQQRWQAFGKAAADRFMKKPPGVSRRIKTPISATWRPFSLTGFPPGWRDALGRFSHLK